MTEHANKENQEFDYDGFVLDPRDYEHPGEKAAFNAIKILMPWGKLEEILFKYVQEPIFNAILAGATVKVSQKQFPPIYNIVQRCSSLLDLTPPDIYVVQDPTYNAFTSGIKDPFIVLHSSLVDAYSEEELTFVIAHELGHIKSEHVRYMIIAQGILFKILDILGMRLLGEGLILALLKWMRMAEYTCDRAGYLACGDAVIASCKAAGFIVDLIEIPAGESSKNLTEVSKALDVLVSLRLGRIFDASRGGA